MDEKRWSKKKVDFFPSISTNKVKDRPFNSEDLIKGFLNNKKGA